MLSCRPVRRSSVLSTAVLLAVLGAAGVSASGPVELISKADPPSAQAVGASQSASMSADGRYVAFASTSPNLAAGQNDVGISSDVFLWDRVAGTVTLVSHASSSDTQGAGGSIAPRISADGQWVAFISRATNLVDGQVDAPPPGVTDDVFLWNRLTGDTVLVSRSASSAVTAGDGSASAVAISANGAYVAFRSSATNLVAGQTDANTSSDIFLYDRTAGTTALVSHASGSPNTTASLGASDMDISGDGRYVVYTSQSTDLVADQIDNSTNADVFLYDRTTGTNALVSHAAGSPATACNGFCTHPRIDEDGSWIAFACGATDLIAGMSGPQIAQVFLYDRTSDSFVLVSHAHGSTTTGANDQSITPSLSADGGHVAFASRATNLIAGQTDSNNAEDIFLFDRAAGTLTLVSGAAGSGTTTANAVSQDPVISADGSRVAFTTLATDLLASESDTNGGLDIFLYDRGGAALELVSHKRLISLQGKPAVPVLTGNGASMAPVLSETGAYVAFTSLATDLTPQSDTNGGSDVFLYPGAGTDILPVSFSPAVTPATANGHSSALANRALSADGRYAVFSTLAANLISGVTDANGDEGDVYLRDRAAGTTLLVSRNVSSASTSGNQHSQNMVISADGGYVAFESFATDLVSGQLDPGPPFGDSDVFLFDRAAGTTLLVSHAPGSPSQSAEGSSTRPAISADGAYVVYSNLGGGVVSGLTDGNAGTDLFLYGRAAGDSILVSRTSSSPTTSGDGPSENAALSADGRYVAFLSKASNLATGQTQSNSDYNVFLFDRIAGTTALVSHAASSPATTGDAGLPSFSFRNEPAVSADGSFIAFVSRAMNLLHGQTDTADTDDLFLWERATGTITLVSRSSASASAAGNGSSDWPTISADGRYVAFTSFASDLVPGQADTNGKEDVFLYDRLTGTTTLVSHTAGSATATPADGDSQRGVVSADGTAVVFESNATGLAPGQTGPAGGFDVFLYDRLSGTARLLSHRSGSATATSNGSSGGSSISADGGTVVFNSTASDLLAHDYNNSFDVFVHARASLDYFTLTPCRLLDTRESQDGPALTSGSTEVFVLSGACGIPATAKALAVNATALQATGAGHLALFPGDFLFLPATSTVNFPAGVSRANNAIIPLAGDGTLAVRPFVSGGGTVHVLLDVAGYFE